jgi:Flp pilus assembly pilin Flp
VSKTVDGAVKPVRKGFGRAETGATAIEYALIAMLISIFIIGALTYTANGVILTYNTINNAMIAVFGN